MINKPRNITLLKFKGLSLDLALRNIEERKYVPLAKTQLTNTPLQVCGVDGIMDEQNIVHTGSFLAFTVIRQSRIENKILIKKEIERLKSEEPLLCEEYGDDVYGLAYDNIASRFQVKTECLDVICNLEKEEAYLLGATNTALSIINAIGSILETTSIYYDPIFTKLENISLTCKGFQYWAIQRILDEKSGIRLHSFKLKGRTDSIKKLHGQNIEGLSETSFQLGLENNGAFLETYRFKYGRTPAVKEYSISRKLKEEDDFSKSVLSYSSFLETFIENLRDMISLFEEETKDLDLTSFCINVIEEVKDAIEVTKEG